MDLRLWKDLQPDGEAKPEQATHLAGPLKPKEGLHLHLDLLTLSFHLKTNPHKRLLN